MIQHNGMDRIKLIACQAYSINLYRNIRTKIMKCCAKPYILTNITISMYCCVYWRTYIIIYWYNTTGWTILKKNILDLCRPQMTVWCMRIACCISKFIDTQSESEYVIFTAFPLQLWVTQSASMSHYTYMCRYNYDLFSTIFYIEDAFVHWFFPRPRRN